MPALTGPFVAALVLLAVAGGFKVWQPESTTGAMASAGLPSSDALTRLLGMAEVGVVAGALFVDGRWFALAAAVLYLGFAGFVAVALRRGLSIQSCGCFGKVDTPPSVAHIVVNLAAAGTLVVVGLTHPAPLGPDLLAASQLPLLLGTGIVAYLAYVLLAVLPLTRRVARP